MSIFILLPILTRSQNYHTLPDSNAKWIVRVVPPGPQYPIIYYLQYIHSFKDSIIINSKKYIKVFGNNNGQGGAYRSDSLGRVYFVPKDSINEYLLFDFSKQAGDTIYNVFTTNFSANTSSLEKYIVDSTSYITVGPYQLKVLYLTRNSYYFYIWIEKIGCLGGGLDNIPCSFPASLICMSVNDTIYYNQGNCVMSFPYTYDTSACTIPTKVQQINLKKAIEVFPNPTNGEIYFEKLPEEKISIKITNVLGLTIYFTYLENKKNFSLSLSDKPSGLYFISIQTNSGKTINKKIIKQ
jgi:hypothetical protein